MIKRLPTLLMLVILFSSAIQAQAQIPLPEKVCIGTDRQYWVDGMASSTYSWRINGVLQSSTINKLDITWLTTGIYNLDVQEHQSSCVGDVQSGMVEVTDQVMPIFVQIPSMCSGSTAISLPTTSLNNITGTWSPAFDNNATTEYTFTPTSGQCATIAKLTITIDPLITPTFAAVGPFCISTVIAALPTISNNNITGSWSPAINNTQTTTYTFTPKTGQCSMNTTLTITIDQSITPIFESIGPYCMGATIASLPTTSNNNITGSWSPFIDNTRTTTYTFTPDANQCAVPVMLIITIGTDIIPTFEAIGPYCSGTAIANLPTISLNGILGTWSSTIVNTQTTIYTFTPDAGQCAVSTVLNIEIAEPIIIAETHIDIDNVHTSGSIDLTVSGGTGPGTYLYSWSNGSKTEDQINLAGGTYVVAVNDNNNCNNATLTIRIESLDFGQECELFIPDAFSPNGDNVHDYFQIYCIDNYPDARIYIFDQLGNKIFDKAHYGNLDFWKTNENAWWSGKPDRGSGNARNEMVALGTYYYVLDLGNGKVKKSFVFVSY